MSPLAAFSFDSLVLWIHVSAVVVGLGVIFSYPVIVTAARRMDPGHAAGVHRVQEVIGRRVISPGLGVVLLAGVYLVIRSPAIGFGDWWVSLGVAVVVVLGALGGAYLHPRESRLAELAERDGAAAEGTPRLSQEYLTLSRQVLRVHLLSAALVLVALFAMVMGSRGAL